MQQTPNDIEKRKEYVESLNHAIKAMGHKVNDLPEWFFQLQRDFIAGKYTWEEISDRLTAAVNAHRDEINALEK